MGRIDELDRARMSGERRGGEGGRGSEKVTKKSHFAFFEKLTSARF